jgi:hypothetical protein
MQSDLSKLFKFLNPKFSRFFFEKILFFTDGSKSEAGASFGVYHSGGPESSFRLRRPSGVFLWL